MTTSVFITTRFEGFHCWPGAPDEVAFLRERHRHIFHVRLDVEVSHDDRDVEFILLKRRVDAEIAALKSRLTADYLETWSCEMWCKRLLKLHPEASRAEVSEDGENGAVVTR